MPRGLVSHPQCKCELGCKESYAHLFGQACASLSMPCLEYLCNALSFILLISELNIHRGNTAHYWTCDLSSLLFYSLPKSYVVCGLGHQQLCSSCTLVQHLCWKVASGMASIVLLCHDCVEIFGRVICESFFVCVCIRFICLLVQVAPHSLVDFYCCCIGVSLAKKSPALMLCR